MTRKVWGLAMARLSKVRSLEKIAATARGSRQKLSDWFLVMKRVFGGQHFAREGVQRLVDLQGRMFGSFTCVRRLVQSHDGRFFGDPLTLTLSPSELAPWALANKRTHLGRALRGRGDFGSRVGFSSARTRPPMGRSSPLAHPEPARITKRLHDFCSDLHHNEEGKITLVATIMMLSLVVLAGLIGNAGHSVNQKLETQNAADATAFSTALWMARGMNALTATNHMLGEATALCAIHESLGGPGLDLRIKQDTAENKRLDVTIKGAKNTAPIGFPVPSPYGFTPPFITKIDKRIVDFVIKRATPSNGELEAFAAIYDSKMTLKRELAIHLTVKSFADVGFFVPPPWGFGTAAVAYGVHLYSTSQIVMIGKEWIVLDVLETVAKAFTPLKLKVIEGQLIPTLAAHGSFVAGIDADTGEFEEGIINSATTRMLLDLTDRHSVETATFPAADKLRLPVEREPKPVPNRSGSSNVPGWGSDEATIPSIDKSSFADLRRKLDKSKRRMQKRIDDMQASLKELDEFEKDIDERLEEDDVSAAEKSELNDEKTAIGESRANMNDQRNQLREDLDKLIEKERQLERQLNQPNSPSANPSVSRIPRKLNQVQERSTQWVRATYPYTDSFRAPILAMFETWLPKSKAADHFTKWSNRYAMIKAWQFRSGFRMEKSGNTATWKRKSRIKPLSMLVMKESFDQGKSRKGKEPWTLTTVEGKKKAEQSFTLLGFSHRDFEPLFSKVVYPAASDTGLTAFSQAVFYNANDQRPTSSSSTQPKVGWDTLNWDPESNVPEWGAPPKTLNAKWPWEIFTSDEQGVKVKLNWQAKLMPVTQSRLQESDVDLDGDMADNVEHAIEFFEELGSH